MPLASMARPRGERERAALPVPPDAAKVRADRPFTRGGRDYDRGLISAGTRVRERVRAAAGEGGHPPVVITGSPVVGDLLLGGGAVTGRDAGPRRAVPLVEIQIEVRARGAVEAAVVHA